MVRFCDDPIDEMMAEGAGRDLLRHAPVMDGVILSDDTIFLDAENVGDIAPCHQHEGGGFGLRLDGEALIMPGQVTECHRRTVMEEGEPEAVMRMRAKLADAGYGS